MGNMNVGKQDVVLIYCTACGQMVDRPCEVSKKDRKIMVKHGILGWINDNPMQCTAMRNDARRARAA